MTADEQTNLKYVTDFYATAEKERKLKVLSGYQLNFLMNLIIFLNNLGLFIVRDVTGLIDLN